MFVGKHPEKAQKRYGIVPIDSFTVVPFDQRLKDIKTAENDFVVLPQKVCAFHAKAPFATASCGSGSAVATTSFSVVFVQKPGAERPRLVRLSSSRGLVNFII
jgi:hypothetical protein